MAGNDKWEDDGHTIADMSGVGRQELGSLFTFGRRTKKEKPEPEVEEKAQDQPQWELTPQERRIYVLGAIGAALLIAFAFIGGLGAAIWLMLKLWT